MTPMAFLNIVLVAAEVLIWNETGASAGLVLPIYVAVNGLFAGLLIFGLGAIHGAEVLGGSRTASVSYSEIDVPSLPAKSARAATVAFVGALRVI